jgi:hypothetical protein
MILTRTSFSSDILIFLSSSHEKNMESNFHLNSVVDLHHLDADPDSTYHPDVDPDSDVYLMRIRIRALLLNMLKIS